MICEATQSERLILRQGYIISSHVIDTRVFDMLLRGTDFDMYAYEWSDVSRQIYNIYTTTFL